MRLIDADKLIEICQKGWRLFGYHDEKLKHWVDEYDIRNQPTVEAIPIEWLKSYIQKLETRLKDNLDLGEDGPTREIVTIEDMLEDWGKENEID